MLTEAIISNLVIERLRLFLPKKMRDNIIAIPNKPEQITSEIIKTKYQDGLLIAGFTESAGTERMTETQVYGVDCLTVGIEQADKLSRFVKICLCGWQIPGASRFEFHDDKQTAQEGGIIVRKINVRCNIPAVPLPDSQIETAVIALSL